MDQSALSYAEFVLNIREKDYVMTLTIDEDDDKIIDVQCHDCTAANGN